MQAAIRNACHLSPIRHLCKPILEMEGFRQRKSTRIREQSVKLDAENQQIVPRGLTTVKRGPVTVSVDLSQLEGREPSVAEELTTLTLDRTSSEPPGPANDKAPRQRQKRKARPTVQAEREAETSVDVAQAPADVPQAVPGKIKNAKRKRATKHAAQAGSAERPAAVTVGSPSATLSVWTQAEMASAVEHLKRCDPGIAALASEMGPTEKLLPKGTLNMFASLARSIAGQQLATQAAFKIHSRFVEICKRTADDPVQPADVLARSHEELRSCGFSGMKANYIHDLARHFDGGLLSDEAIAVMDDETLITELTKVKGIGRWSVDMFAMFHLGRMDVLPVGDLGIRNGMKLLYGLPGPPKPEEMEQLTEFWRPYRSLGSFYLWGFLAKKAASAKKSSTPKKAKKTTLVNKVPL